MNTMDILKAIDKLPVPERLSIIEKVVQEIRRQQNEQQLTIAAEALFEEYKSNKDLTAFTNLDPEDFYEAK